MDRKRILINALSSVLQFLANAIIIFIFYKFLLNTIGVKDLGIWSLVLAFSSITQIAGFGFSGGAVKFVAKYATKNDPFKTSLVIQTSLISVTVLVGVFLLILFPLIKLIFSKVVPADSITMVYLILPIGLCSIWLTAISGVLYASLDGYQRMDAKNALLIVGGIINLLLCFWFVPKLGLIGLAYLTICQNTILLISAWVILKLLNSQLPFIPFKWDHATFGEVISYNIKFQAIFLISIFLDPVTRLFLSRFGGLSLVGFYELASKMTLQVRGFIVSANLSLVPAIASISDAAPEKIRSIYIYSVQLLIFLVVPLYCILALSIPVISYLWVGYYNHSFVMFSIILLVSHFFNIVSNPAYFSNLGQGHLNPNLLEHILIGLLNLILSIVLGKMLGGVGTVFAFAIALTYGSLFLFFNYNKVNKISLAEILPVSSRNVLLICLMGLLAGTSIYFVKLPVSYPLLGLLSAGIFILVTIFPLWKHPMRARFMNMLGRSMISKPGQVHVY